MFIITYQPKQNTHIYLKFQRRMSSFAFFLKKWKFDRRAMNIVLVLSYRIQKNLVIDCFIRCLPDELKCSTSIVFVF